VKPKCKDNIYEAATIELLEKACADLKDRVLMVLLVDAGMRVGEVSHALQAWWNGQTLRIPASQDCNCHECRNDKKHPGVWKPKSAAGKRIIPIAPMKRAYLSMYFRENPGIGLSRIQIYRRLKSLGEKAGVQGNIFPHALRATYITRLIEKKVSTWVVRQLVGHENVATTSAYAKLSEKVITDEVSRSWR